MMTDGRRADSGRALIEVLFLAVLLLIPTVYILLGVLRVQSATLAAAQAARDVGRLVEISLIAPSAHEALAIAEVAFRDQHLPTEHVRLATADTPDNCADSEEFQLSYQPGADYQICVIAVIDLPGVPTVIAGSSNTVTGTYRIHMDMLREG